MGISIGYLATGVRLGMLLRLLRKGKISWYPLYILRFLFLLQNAFWFSFFSWLEKRRYGSKINQYPLPEDPVFIIGHWRTGSTYLHKLLSLDGQFATPTFFQTFYPETFISARPYFAHVMQFFISKHRPFDQVKAGVDEPQEDEFALLRLSADSPMSAILLPKSKDYILLNKDCSFIPGDGLWYESLDYFYRKIAWMSGKRLLMKNPFHSMRIGILRKHFPKAKFIHIYRNPLDVVPSAQKLWNKVGAQNTLNRNWHTPSIEEVTDFLSVMTDEIHTQLSALPAGSCTEICYEKLVKDPVHEIKEAYRALGLEFTPGFGQKLTAFLDELGTYRRNTYCLSDANKEYICTKMRESMKRYGYMDGTGDGCQVVYR